MKIYYSPYSLKPAKSLNNIALSGDRQGVLLKIEYPDGSIGYSDLHPWPELGDPSWEDQLAGIRKGQISSMLEQSIWLARRDADARRDGKNLFEALTPMKNNYLVTDIDTESEDLLKRLNEEGFETLKIKVGRDLQKESDFVSRMGYDGTVKLRLDFNGVGSWQTFERFMSSLNKVAVKRIEYIEDPFPYDAEAWNEARKFAPLAIDNQSGKLNWSRLREPPFDVVILKPAKMDVMKTLRTCVAFDLKITVTSYMDHPVGVMHALAVANELKRVHPQRILDAGCLTTSLFQMEPYGAEAAPAGPYLKRATGLGIGFDQLLEKEPWAQVKLR